MPLDINIDEYEVCETWTCRWDRECKAEGPQGTGWTLVQMTPLTAPRHGAFGDQKPCIGCLYLWKRKREGQTYR